MKLSALFILFTCVACGQSGKKLEATSKHKVDPKAVQLSDSAFKIVRQSFFNDSNQVKAIKLLDQATEIDSEYYRAYWNKLSLQDHLKKYDDAIRTAQHIMRIMKDNSPYFYFTVGQLYYKNNDSVMANKYFKDALNFYDKISDTITSDNHDYNSFLLSKGILLVVNNQEEKGKQLLKKAYDRESEGPQRKIIESIMTQSKRELLENYKGAN
jgi:tetratricopeptide (TPR) repeat protein